jgi:hypothetical protein
MRHEVVCPHCGRAFAPSGGSALPTPVADAPEFAPPEQSDIEDPPPAADLLWRADDDVDLLRTPDPDGLATDEVPTVILGLDEQPGAVRDAADNWVAAVQRDAAGKARPAQALASVPAGAGMGTRTPAWAVGLAVYAGIATLACAWLLWQAAPMVLPR